MNVSQATWISKSLQRAALGAAADAEPATEMTPPTDGGNASSLRRGWVFATMLLTASLSIIPGGSQPIAIEFDQFRQHRDRWNRDPE